MAAQSSLTLFTNSPSEPSMAASFWVGKVELQPSRQQTRGGTVWRSGVGCMSLTVLHTCDTTYLVGSNTNNLAYHGTTSASKHSSMYPVPASPTVLRMQLNKEVAKGPVCNALSVGFPVRRSAGERRSRKLGQGMEVDVVGHCVEHVGKQGSCARRQQYRCGG
ncbi:hypothetical protein IG631_16968 [Alternaria alternata]|nr:hypothetical protein IG631_16968 [Alternaria alternata]